MTIWTRDFGTFSVSITLVGPTGEAMDIDALVHVDALLK
jgi:hypothetical protein